MPNLNPHYSVEECRALDGHYSVAAAWGGVCHRCGISISGPGLHTRVQRPITDPTRIVSRDPAKNVEWVGPDGDRATLVGAIADVPDPLRKIPGGKKS